jgi:acyl-CoA dehydrogenase
LELLEWACSDSFRKIAEAFEGFISNFPNRPAALLLKLMTFPFGFPSFGPRDRLGHRVAKVLLEPSEVRDRLTAGIFIPTNTDEPLGRLEDALVRVIAAEPVEKKVRDAAKEKRIPVGNDERMLQAALQACIITTAEADIVLSANAARREVIRVDDFPADYWRKGEEHE